MENASLNKIFTLKTLIPFHDMENDNVKRFKGEEFECDEKRAKGILNHGIKLVEIVSIIHGKE